MEDNWLEKSVRDKLSCNYKASLKMPVRRKKEAVKRHRPGAHYIFTDRLDRKTTTRGVKAWRTCYRTLS